MGYGYVGNCGIVGSVTWVVGWVWAVTWVMGYGCLLGGQLGYMPSCGRNYSLRVMPLPLYDIGRARKGVEEYVQTVQKCLCRNHSDERLKVEIAARHRGRLLTASQQSVSCYS